MSVDPRKARAVFQGVGAVLLATATAVSLGGCGGSESTQPEKTGTLTPKPGTIVIAQDSSNYLECKLNSSLDCDQVFPGKELYIQTTEGSLPLKSVGAIVALESNSYVEIHQRLSARRSMYYGGVYDYDNTLKICSQSTPNKSCASSSGPRLSHVAVNGKIWPVTPLPFQPGREVSTQTLRCQDRGEEHPCKPAPVLSRGSR